MDRPTIELILPKSGAKIILYTYLTSGQYREIQKGLLKDLKFDPTKGEDQKMGDIPVEVVYEQQDQTLKYLVKEIHSAEGELISDPETFIFNLNIEDGNALYAKVNELDNSSRLSSEAKKK